MKLRLQQVAEWTDGRRVGTGAEISSVSTDTRTLDTGALYVALAGERIDGHDLLDNARERGAVAALVDHDVANVLPQIVVADVPRALGALARAWRTRHTLRCVGITGSNGKTTVKTLVGAILARHGATHVNPGNRNNEIGLPLSVLAMPEDTRYLVLEMGAGKPGDIAWLADIAQPDIALVNNVAHAHVERMGSLDGVAQTKGALISALPAAGVAIINADDAYADYFTRLADGRRCVRFGISAPAEVHATFRADAGAHSVSSTFALRTPQGSADIDLPLPGRHNVANALAASAIAFALEVPLGTIRDGLQDAIPVVGRLTYRGSASGARVIDDSYNANPASFAAAIALLASESGTRVLAMGDMGELGADSTAMHADVGALARRSGIDELHAVGVLSRAAVEAFGEAATHHRDQAGLIDALRKHLHSGATILVKGSRAAGMEKVVAALCGVGDEQPAGNHGGEARHAA